MRRRLVFAAIVLMAAGDARAQAGRPATPAPPAAPAIDLNSASRDELMTLEGIGEVRADAIIRSRPFKAKTELVERRIIPEALYDRINGKVLVRAVPAPAGSAPAPRR